MTELARALRPLEEARRAIHLLDTYTTPAELGGAVQAVWGAVEQSLRLLLRADRQAPDALRLAALSSSELPTERVIEALRQRELISIELAGSVHELERAAVRAARDDVRAADADVARRAAALLREEIGKRAGEAGEASEAPARGAEERGMKTVSAEPVPVETDPERWPGARRMRLLAAGIALLALVALVIALLRGLDDSMEEATAAFAAGRFADAERLFEGILADAPNNVDALLYLGRIHRREGDYEAAARRLREAARIAPQDPHVRRELGHLFMELGRPRAAAEQYQRAVEVEPEDERAWIGLIRALRAAGDARAEDLLKQAPPEVRAVLTTME